MDYLGIKIVVWLLVGFGSTIFLMITTEENDRNCLQFALVFGGLLTALFALYKAVKELKQIRKENNNA